MHNSVYVFAEIELENYYLHPVRSHNCKLAFAKLPA